MFSKTKQQESRGESREPTPKAQAALSAHPPGHSPAQWPTEPYSADNGITLSVTFSSQENLTEISQSRKQPNKNSDSWTDVTVSSGPLFTFTVNNRDGLTVFLLHNPGCTEHISGEHGGLLSS